MSSLTFISSLSCFRTSFSTRARSRTLAGFSFLVVVSPKRSPQKVEVDEFEDERGEQRMDAVDGGTTATIIAVLDGATLVIAQVGDSSALLGGMIKEGDEGEGEVTFHELMEEHAATNRRARPSILAVHINAR